MFRLGCVGICVKIHIVSYAFLDSDKLYPLEYLLKPTDVAKEGAPTLFGLPSITSPIQYLTSCLQIIPGEEIPGELVLSSDHLYFIPEHSIFRDEHVVAPFSSIVCHLKRRYVLQDRAIELFETGRSFFFAFKSVKERDELATILLCTEISNLSYNANSKSSMLQSPLSSVTSQWLKGKLSNFDYLMYLNTSAGRTYCDLMQYPVFPFVLAKYDCPTLDLFAAQSFRELRKPMAIQDPSKEAHFASTYNVT